MKLSTISSLSVAVLASWCTLAAQEAPEGAGTPPARPPQGPKMPPAVLKAFDKDGDGTLSETERAAMRESVQAGMKKYDADGDGKLSPAEIEKAKAENPGLAQMMAARGPKGPGEGGPGPKAPAEVLKAYDKDGDGTLSKTEREAFKSDVQAAVKKYDANADGKLTGEELEKAKAANPALASALEKAGQQRHGQPGDRPNKEHKGKKDKDAPGSKKESASAE